MSAPQKHPFSSVFYCTAVQGTALLVAGLLAAAGMAAGMAPVLAAEGADPQHAPGEAAAEKPATQPPWQSLFDGQTLAPWRIANFGGEGEVEVKDGQLLLDFGVALTGVTYPNEVPTMNYELQLEAMRVDGIDFFCGLTFPVADSHCSFIVGGWAGSVVGLSSIDGEDASRNATTRYMTFKTGQWYTIRVRVTPEKIQAWIDDQQVVDQATAGRRISTRSEVDLSKPLGISAWQTRAALRHIQLRRLQGAARK